MHSVRELITLSADYLQKKGVPSPRRDAEELLAFYLECKRMELYFDYDKVLEEREVTFFREAIRRRGKREPLAYITGAIPFLDLQLKVTPATLIPRQETEILTAHIIKQLPPEKQTLWDLCCGSGCIGLSLKKARPDCAVTLSDLSEAALAIAKENGECHQLEVTFLHGDLLAPFAGKCADLVVCNPPYVTKEEYATLEEEVRLYEPEEALIGGLSFYERLAKELPPHLNPGAHLFLEIGATQKEAVMALFSAPEWTARRCISDWAGYDARKRN